jgi:hypothetical protein
MVAKGIKQCRSGFSLERMIPAIDPEVGFHRGGSLSLIGQVER